MSVRGNSIQARIRPQGPPVTPQKPRPVKHRERHKLVEEVFQEKRAATGNGIGPAIDRPLPPPHLNKTVRHNISSPLSRARNRDATPPPQSIDILCAESP